jgi:hypothetical protein
LFTSSINIEGLQALLGKDPGKEVEGGNMKLAEGLAIRADQQKRLLQLQRRITNNAQVQEGDKPAEDPNKLLAEYLELADGLLLMINRINLTNNQGVLSSGQTLAAAVTYRDHLKRMSELYRLVADAGVISKDRYSRAEIKTVSMIDVSKMQEFADQTSAALRKLDTEIQEANWTVDLL